MTTIQVFQENETIVRVKASGHAGTAPEGYDIYCAAVSSILETTLLGLEKIAKVKFESVRNRRKGFLEFWISSEQAAVRDCQVILLTMLAGLTEVATSFPRYIQTEVIQL